MGPSEESYKMRARIVIIDKRGLEHHGEVELRPSDTNNSSTKRTAKPLKQERTPEFDFDTPLRAFVKDHTRELTGPKKFVLLTAYLARGDQSAEVELRTIEQQWNRMTSSSLMGGSFNRKFSAVARENGWVDNKKPGVYVLTARWKLAFRKTWPR
jgi:hypothetical protein